MPQTPDIRSAISDTKNSSSADKAAFLRNYALLFGAKLRAAILAQDPESVFENAQGLMIGEGRYNVWIRDTGDGDAVRYQIIAINGP